MWSKLSFIFSLAALTVAIILFFKGSSGVGDQDVEPVHVAPAFTAEGGPRATVVAFVNGDSLNAKYDFIVEKSKELASKMKAAEERVAREYGPRQAEYEKAMRYYQENPGMSEKEAMALENDIKRLQQEMDDIQQREVGVLQKKEADLQNELTARVNKFLDAFSKQKGIDFVLNKQSEFQLILFGNGAYDITSEVIAGLNAEYKIEKETK